MAAASYIEMMIDSLNKKIAVLEEINKLNNEQKVLFEQGENMDESAYDISIERKSDLIDELLRLDDGFVSLFENVKREMGDNKSKYSAEIKLIQDRIRHITDLSGTIEVTEKRNKAVAEKYFNESRLRIKESKQNSGAAIKYYQNMRGKNNIKPQFFDSKN